MVQLDGSPHRYNGKDIWTLINVIGDATSKLLSSEFSPGEKAYTGLKALRNMTRRYGIPEFIITDRVGWSAKMGKRAHFSQFERALKELGCTIIATSSAPSEGHVERSFRTYQDRLVSELRFNGNQHIENATRRKKEASLPSIFIG